jgi:predicted dehydrogenase
MEALKAGKHVMCTVPMATNVADCEKICQLVADTGLKYMMAETVVYSREFLFIKEMYKKGELGKIQYLAASHPQDMDGWPDYWQKMIPMHYATHVVSPCLGLMNGRAEYVSCFGSGTVRKDIAKKSGNKYAVESCHIKIKDTDVVAHIWRFLYDTARQYRESFDVYGTKKSFEWTLVEHEPHIIHTAKKPEPEIPSKVTVPDYLLRSRSAGLRSRRKSTTPSTCRSFKAADTAAPTRTSSTNSLLPSSSAGSRGPTPRPAPTGPASACALTSRLKRAEKS